MKNLKILLVFGLTMYSCIDNEPITNTFSNCSDTDYYGFRTIDLTNSSSNVEVVKNLNTTNITNNSFGAQYSFNYSGVLDDKSSSYDKNTETIVFLDRSGLNTDLIIYDVANMTHQIVTLQSSRVILAPTFIGGRLFVLEFDSVPWPNVYLKEVLNLSTGSLSAALLTIPKASFNTSNTSNSYVYSTTNGLDTIYFLGTSLLEVQITQGFPNTIRPVPTPGYHQYFDIVHIQSGELLTVSYDPINLKKLQKWDISNPTLITETTQIASININNVQSIELVYKECGDLLHILSQKNNNETRIHEVDVLTNNITTTDFPGIMFGIVHKSL